jgi:hypothetical protein
MFQHGQHRDRIPAGRLRLHGGEKTGRNGVGTRLNSLYEERFDTKSLDQAIAERAQEFTVKRADVDQAHAVRQVAKRAPDPALLQDAIKKTHATDGWVVPSASPMIAVARLHGDGTHGFDRTTRTVEAGLFASFAAGRIGRRTSSPPQFGHT